MSQPDLFAPAPQPPQSPADPLARLNEAQRRAVETIDGPVLVLAGAGTGKTRVLTTRLAHILMLRRAFPSQVLAVTFTNKAAREMKERLEAMIGGAADGLWLGTFHSIAARILRRHAELLGLQPNFTILDTDDQLRLLKQLLEAEGIDDKRWPARAASALIQRWKDRAQTPDKVPEGEAGDFAGGRLIRLYRQYQDRLRTLNAVDFGDLTLHNLTLFTTRPEVLADYQRRFRYILVDEYQDTNVAQYLWLRLLAQQHRNLCCVGDDDQCVAEGTRITMADGSECPVQQIVAGDEVLSCYGSGEFRAAPVLRVHRRRSNRPLVRIRTAAGRELTTTAEHVHFADVVLTDSPQKFYTYLMHKRGYGYRLGTSQVHTEGQQHPVVGFKQRAIQEHADAVWLVSAFDNENDARELEHRLSLTYGITTLPFVARKGGSVNGIVHDQARLDRLHKEFSRDEAALRLMNDHGLDPAAPHHVPQSAPGRRRNLTVTLNAERRGPTPMHRISMSGNDAAGRELVAQAGFNARVYARNPANWRYESIFHDLGRVEEIRQRLSEVFDLIVVRKANLLGRALTARPALQVRPGMVMAAADGRHDAVLAVEPVEGAAEVWDLDIGGTHNFIANGLVTHNSIYSWRGAEIGNILRFEKDFPGAAIIRLEQNYRSTPHILAAAGGLIANNSGRLGKTLWTSANEGEKVRLRALWDADEEARWVGDEIEALQRKGEKLAEIAILVRAGFQTREFEERFITLGLPYRVVGGPRFYERQEIRDALAYLRLIHQPADDLAFERIVNLPRRGIGNTTLQSLHLYAREKEMPLLAAAETLVTGDALKPAARKALQSFVVDVARWRSLAVPHPQLLQIVLDESGYTTMWQQDKSADAPGRLENLKELVAAMSEFDNLAGFLEHVGLVMENAAEAGADMVSLMTLHSAKGLEFDNVFLPGWEEGLFPNQRSLDEGGMAGLEEERRLAYVGLTRAKRRAAISYAANRRIHGQWQSAIASRFVGELPQEHLEILAEPGLQPRGNYFGAREASWGGGFGRDDFGGGYSDAGRTAAPRGLGELRRSPPRPLIESRPVPQRGAEVRRVGGFAVGDRIFHQKFGYGRVRVVEDNKLTIDFEHAGEKKVMDAFVEKA